MSALSAAERLQLLQCSWTTVAAGYAQHFVPRFMPWTRQALQLFAAARPPPRGTIAVPACGPGQELPLLAAAFPQHRIVGLDLSDGMVALARQVVEREGLAGRVEVRVADASRMPPDLQQLAGVVSVFGLQQMPAPADVLAAWAQALQPGGALCVCFWPQQVEARGPWQLLTRLTAGFRPQADWEAGIPGKALEAAGPGAELAADERWTHEMAWPSAAEFWECITRAGPWHSRRLLFGDEHMEELRRQFMQELGVGEAEPLAHSPAARVVCLRRGGAAAAL